MNIIQNLHERIKAFLMNYARNSSHTLSADIKELVATYILSFGYYMLYILPQNNELKRTRNLKNTKKGKNCFVFANGPSMNLLDMNKVKQYQKAGFDVICINQYIISESAKTIVPDFYVLSDPFSFKVKNVTRIKEGEINNNILKKLYELKVPVFIPAEYSKNCGSINYYIFNDFGNHFKRRIDLTKPRGYYPSGTAYKALAAACYLGYSGIFICGLDNDYFKSFEVDIDNKIYYNDKHFYDDDVKKEIGPRNGKGLGNLLWDQYMLFKHLELFNNYNIVNLNKNGLVDAFPKKHNLNIYKEES